MKPYFADTWYFLSLVNTGDPSHQRVLEFVRTLDRIVVTSEWVLTEVGDALASPSVRRSFTSIVKTVETSPSFRLLRATSSKFSSGSRLFDSRPDKAWSLTDCISFVLMQDLNLHEALTADRHFVQAGFKARFLP